MVLRTAPHKEQQAAANVENKLLLEAYAPKLKELHQTKPLFPGYSFARTPHDRWHRLLRLKHVRGILMASDHPSWLPNQVILQLKAQEQPEGYLAHTPRFTFRQRLSIVGGPFTQGLYLGMAPKNRVRVLFALLGQDVEAEVDLKRVGLEAH